MRRNKEAALIEDSLGKITGTGKVLKVVFSLGAAFFLFLLLLDGATFVGGLLSGVSASELLSAIAAAIQDLVMLYAFIVCALVARDASRAITPFSAQQVRRTLSVGWVLLGYTLFFGVGNMLVAVVVVIGIVGRVVGPPFLKCHR